MISDNWFQVWHPPANLVPDQQNFHAPIHLRNFNSTYDLGYPTTTVQKRPYGRPDTFLPYLVSLSLFRPKPRQYYEDETKILERTGPFKTWYYWKQLDFAYPTEGDRDRAIFFQEFIQENNLPLGLEVWKDRLFVTMPKWKPGVPASLAVIPKVPKEPSPRLVPYPSWEWHQSGNLVIHYDYSQ